jgi:hypothetical protein
MALSGLIGVQLVIPWRLTPHHMSSSACSRPMCVIRNTDYELSKSGLVAVLKGFKNEEVVV